MTEDAVPIRPFGEAALLVELGATVDAVLARRARWLARAVDAMRTQDPRWGRPVAAAASVLVPFDPLALAEDEAREVLAGLAASAPFDPPPEPAAREIVVPVRYGGADGPDLADVARALGLTTDAFVAMHVAAEHEVLFLGFAPGFPYIAGLPDGLAVPRLPEPRVRVAAGSVGVAGRLTGIYPYTSPGGWRIIGCTELRIFDPAAPQPALLRPGDLVRFVAR